MIVSESLQQVQTALLQVQRTLREMRLELNGPETAGTEDDKRSFDLLVLPEIDSWDKQLAALRKGDWQRSYAEIRHVLHEIYAIAGLIDMDLRWSAAYDRFDRESTALVNLAAAADKTIREA